MSSTQVLAPSDLDQAEDGAKQRFKARYRDQVLSDVVLASIRTHKKGDCLQVVITPEHNDNACLYRCNDCSHVRVDIAEGSDEERWLIELFDDLRPARFSLTFSSLLQPVSEDRADDVYLPTVTFTRMRSKITTH